MSHRVSLLLGVCLLLAAPSTFAAVYTVFPDGTGDYPTIQAAIDAAQPGDTISLVDGVFTGNGNRRLKVFGKGITIRSSSGDPDLCVIDCAGNGRAFFFSYGEGPGTVIEGITMRNGHVHYPDYGGGAIYAYEASPTIRNCAFENNTAAAQTRDPGYGTGGAIYVENAQPLFQNCSFAGNSADYDGGAVRLVVFASSTFEGCVFTGNQADAGGAISIDENSSPLLTGCDFQDNSAGYAGAIMIDRISNPQILGCTFDGNSASGAGGAICIYYTSKPLVQGCLFTNNTGGGGGAVYSGYFSEPVLIGCTFHGNDATVLGSSIYSYYYSSVTVENSIIAAGQGGGSVHCLDGGTAAFSCSDIWGNMGGDWIGCVAGQFGVDGNISDDPLFCDVSGGNFRVDEASPCAAAHSPAGCGTIGIGEGCVNVGVECAVNDAPKGLLLQGARPNPFNPTATIRFTVPAGGETVLLTVHDVSGRLVRTLVNGARSAGEHEAIWDGRDDRGGEVASGVYFSRLSGGGESRTGRMVLIR